MLCIIQAEKKVPTGDIIDYNYSSCRFVDVSFLGGCQTAVVEVKCPPVVDYASFISAQLPFYYFLVALETSQ